MGGFAVFIIALVVIWTLSGIATWVNKQKEMERRRMLRDQLNRPPGAPPRVAPRAGAGRPKPKTISRGIADRFPDVLLPPKPQPPMRKPMPPRQPARPAPMRQPVQSRPVAKRPRQQQRSFVQEQAVPVLLVDDAPRPPMVQSAPPPLPSKQQPAAPRITADTISRWLRPATLNQQFLLTEIFQPPLALRDRHLL